MDEMKDHDVRKIKWGEIYYCDLGAAKGSVQSKMRPVMIVQNNVGNENGPTTVVAAISSVMKKMYLPTHIPLGPECGLREQSIVMLEQIRTIDTKDLMDHVGAINDKATIEAIKRGIAIEMGVIECPKPSQKLILSLCPRCRSSYLNIPGNRIRRVDPFQENKEPCDMCQRAFGFDYYIKKRPTHPIGTKALLSHK